MRFLTQLSVALVGAAVLTGCGDDASTSTAPMGRGFGAGEVVAAKDQGADKVRDDVTIVSGTGDITSVVGGATNKPIPSAPKKIEPKGGSGHTGSLLEAKRRAQQQIRQKEKGED